MLLMKDIVVSCMCLMEVNVNGGRLVKYRIWILKILNKLYFFIVF